MLYTSVLPKQLLSEGFHLDFQEKNDEVNYECFEKGVLNVTVDHAMKKVSVFVQCEKDFELQDMATLHQLDALLNDTKR
ncbi:MAG: hypothetical protein ABI207_09310 [Crocinitomicaceae bacterium]